MMKERDHQQDKTGQWRNWAIGFVVWTIVGASFGTRSYLYAQITGPPPSFREMILNYMADFYIWGAYSPVIFWICKRFPIGRGKVAGPLAIHFFVGFVSVMAVTAVTIPATWYLGLTNTVNYPTLGLLFSKLFTNPFMVHQGLLAYWGTVVVAQAFEYYRQVQIETTRASDLAAQLAQAQLAALKMQIHPHFLFNTLNSIATLLHRDVEAADRMIARLSDFLRMTLNSSQTTASTLGQELEFLQAYLEIEQIRFQERLIVKMDIAPDVLDAQVPNLILQPLVENAVRHGISKQIAVGRLHIFAHRENERLLIRIEDNGPGLHNGSRKPKTRPKAGVGLENTKARLEKFYRDFQFEIIDRQGTGGTCVKLNVPYLIQE